jgi:hypothetical protein
VRSLAQRMGRRIVAKWFQIWRTSVRAEAARQIEEAKMRRTIVELREKNLELIDQAEATQRSNGLLKGQVRARSPHMPVELLLLSSLLSHRMLSALPPPAAHPALSHTTL